MRILIVDEWYPGFVDDVYAKHPGLTTASFEIQLERFREERFGESSFELAALTSLGHDVLSLPMNVPQLVNAWARENRVTLPGRLTVGVRWGGRIPRPSRLVRDAWLTRALQEMVAAFKPDVIRIQAMESMPRSTLEALRSRAWMLVGQSGSPVPPPHLDLYDLFVSIMPHYVEQARRAGVPASYLPLAFEPKLAGVGDSLERDIGVSFVGSVGPYHRRRIHLLEAIGRSVAVDAWVPELPPAWRTMPPPLRFHESVWGRQMYEVLGRSRITLNVHTEASEGYAANLRLYEATGMGALLVTEAASNLSSLFEPGVEVVAYEGPEDMIESVRYYVDHPDEAMEIARRGYLRLLRDHTWETRMAQLVSIIESARQERDETRLVPHSANGPGQVQTG